MQSQDAQDAMDFDQVPDDVFLQDAENVEIGAMTWLDDISLVSKKPCRQPRNALQKLTMSMSYK